MAVTTRVIPGVASCSGADVDHRYSPVAPGAVGDEVDAGGSRRCSARSTGGSARPTGHAGGHRRWRRWCARPGPGQRARLPAAIVRNSGTTKEPSTSCWIICVPFPPGDRRAAGLPGGVLPSPGPRVAGLRARQPPVDLAARFAQRVDAYRRPTQPRRRRRGHPAGRRFAVRSLEDLHGGSARHTVINRDRFLPDRRPDPRRSLVIPDRAWSSCTSAATTSTAARRRSSCSPTRRR
jgi:hypothetical protein